MAKNKATPPSKGKATQGQTASEREASTQSPTDGAETEDAKVTEKHGDSAEPNATPSPTASANPASVTIIAPVASEVVGFTRRGVSIKSLTVMQRSGLQRLRNGLVSARETLADGTPVMNDSMAVRWLLEQV